MKIPPYLFWTATLILLLALCSTCSYTIPNHDLGNSSPAIYGIWADTLLQAIKRHDSIPTSQTAGILVKANDLASKPNWELYLMAALTFVEYGKIDSTFVCIDKSIRAGGYDTSVLVSIAAFEPLHSDPRWPLTIALADSLLQQSKSRIENPELQEALQALWNRDQQALQDYEDAMSALGNEATSKDHSRFFANVEKVWHDNTIAFDSILTLYGWPGIKLVGKEGAKLSWAIPQHSADVGFKLKCLPLLLQAAQHGDATFEQYAELYDRIARDTWQKQRFGSSMNTNMKRPYPILDASSTNQRRLRLGLAEPIELYAQYHGFEYNSPTKAEALADSLSDHQEALNGYRLFVEQMGRQETDSAIANLSAAIKRYGNLSNEQLLEAAKLIVSGQHSEQQWLALKILKVLIWRGWPGSKEFEHDPALFHLRENPGWAEIKHLLSTH